MADGKEPPTGKLEIIDGHSYFIVRDVDGNILRQEARDIAVIAPNPVKIVGGDNVAAANLLTKTPATITQTEIAAMLQFLVKKALSR